jgi:Domain of unknown function (DUF4349)
MRTTRPAMAAAALLAVTVALAGCSGGSKDAATAGGAGEAQAPAAQPREAQPGDQSGKVPEAPSTDKDQKESGGSSQPSIARAIVRTGSLTVQVKDVDGDDDVLDARQQVSTIVSGLRGIIANEETGNDQEGAIGRASLVLRIPTASYDNLVRRLAEELGTVKLLKQSSSDVTEQVVDVNSRIANQRAGLNRMRALLARARTVSEIITVESELTRREADLESLLARQKALADQTELATLTVTLLQPAKPAPPPPADERGFVHGLSKGWGAFSNTATALATAAGALLPFLVMVALLAVPGWLLFRRQRRTATAPATAPPD